MANAQSNPMSEYDFAEIRDDISDEQGETLHVNKTKGFCAKTNLTE